jgi:hypothetical protein
MRLIPSTTSPYVANPTINVSSIIYIGGASPTLHITKASFFFQINTAITDTDTFSVYKLNMYHPSAGIFTRQISLKILSDEYFYSHAVYEPYEINSQRSFSMFYNTVYKKYKPASWMITLTKI